jgi:hypothetical protein
MDQEIINFKNQLTDTNRSGLVLDIDETLAWTIGYWVSTMQQKFGNPENLSVVDMVAKYRYTQNVPYWQTPEALEWMEAAREDNDLQPLIAPIVAASDTVNQINPIIPIVAYLTTRPQCVVSGTKKWLEIYGFPDVPILARPPEVPSEVGDKWKSEALNYLYPQVKGIIDDKSAIAEFLPADYPGVVFLFNNPSTDIVRPKVIPCPIWPDVYSQVKEFFKPTDH